MLLKSLLPVSAAALLALSAIGGIAQNTSANNGPLGASAPPQKTYARVVQEIVKHGDWSQYEEIQEARATALREANWPYVSVALVPIAGPDEVFHFRFFDSFADLAKERADLDKNPELKAKLEQLDLQEKVIVESRRVFFITYHPNISYQGDFNWPGLRFTSIIFIHLHPGHGDEYLANRKIVLAAHSAAHLPENLALFTTFAGGPSSSYWIIRPVKTLAGFDEMSAIHGDAYGKILGDANRKLVHQYFAMSVETEQEDYFRSAPELSYITSEWAGEDAGYWLGAK